MFGSLRLFVKNLAFNFGGRFTLLLVSVYALLKGSIRQLSSSAQLPYFQALGITGDKYQSYGTVAMTPWAMKAAIGLLSDTVPILGYHKRSYMVLVSIIGTASYAVLGSVQLSAAAAPLAAFLLMVGNLQVATVDLLCEGKYAEMMVAKPESGSDLVSFVWGMYMTGTFVGSIVAGPMAEHLNPRYIFLVCLPLAAQVIFPTVAGWLPENRLPRESRGVRMDKVRAHPDLFKLSVMMTLGAMAVGFSALFGAGGVQSLVSIVTAFVLCVLGMRWLPPMLGKANLYMFLSSMLYVSLPGALDYWFTAEEACVPDGPHFDLVYYVTYAALVGALAGAVGVSAFQTFLSRGNFRTAFWVTGLVKLTASAFDIVIVERLNRRIGISDKVAFMLGDAIVYQVALMLDLMPAVVLTSKVCPKGMEASVYALLASYQNLGSNVSRALGVALIDYLGIKTTVPCNFSNLSKAIFYGHVLLPLFVFPLVFVLIPDAKMTDDLVGVDKPDESGPSEFRKVPGEDPEEGLGAPLEGADEDNRLVEEEGLREPREGSDEGNRLVAIHGVEDDGGRRPGSPIDVIEEDSDEDIAHSDNPSIPSFTPETPPLLREPRTELELPSSVVEENADDPVHNSRE